MDPHWPRWADLQVWPVNNPLPPGILESSRSVQGAHEMEAEDIICHFTGLAFILRVEKPVVIWREPHSVHCVHRCRELEEDRKPSYTSEESW